MTKKYYYMAGLLVICTILTLCGYFFLIRSVWDKAGLVASHKNDILFGDQKKEYADNMLLSFETTQKDIDTLQNFFVTKQGEVEFIEFIESTAKAKGLTVGIDTVSLDSPSEIGNHGMEYLVLRLHVTGTWSRVWNFSEALETLPYSIDVTSLALLREDSEQKNPVTWRGVYNIKVLKKK